MGDSTSRSPGAAVLTVQREILGVGSYSENRHVDTHHAVLIDGTLCGYTTRTEH